jgi:LmbE family N-acetylglucosaminyl deacetylase
MTAQLASCDAQHITGVEGEAGSSEPPYAATESTAAVEFYIHAHQDDWQLFMGDRAYHAFQGGARIVFVYTTAGDAGLDERYWQTRESAAQAAVDVIVGAGAWACAVQTIATRPIRRCAKGNAVSYYMRMPGGNGSDGMGYGKGSLILLRDSARATTAVDGSTTYATWADFYTTLSAIVDFEANGTSPLPFRVHAPDYDRALNPGDHPDHWVTADAVHAATGPRGWAMSWYVDYETRRKSINLTDSDHTIKQREFYAYDDVMAAAGYETLKGESWYQAWLWRTYFRDEQPMLAPAAPSSLTATAVSASRLDLAWTDNSSIESGFKVERAGDSNGVPGTYAQIGTTAAGQTRFSDVGLAAGTRYWYRVRAYNAYGESAYSSAASATTATDTTVADTPPSNLTVVRSASGPKGKGGSKASLSWTRGTGSMVDVWRNSKKIAAGISNVGSYDDSLGNKSGNYTYQVCLAGKTGTASCSNSASLTF